MARAPPATRHATADGQTSPRRPAAVCRHHTEDPPHTGAESYAVRHYLLYARTSRPSILPPGLPNPVLFFTSASSRALAAPSPRRFKHTACPLSPHLIMLRSMVHVHLAPPGSTAAVKPLLKMPVVVVGGCHRLLQLCYGIQHVLGHGAWVL